MGFFANRSLKQGISALYEQNNWKLALSALSKAIERDPKLFEAYFFRAVAHLRGEQYEEGINDCTRAIQINPNHQHIATVYLIRGRIYGITGQMDAAIADFSRIIELELPSVDIVDAYFHRGQAYSSTRRFSQALEDFNEVIKRNPDKKNAYFERGTTYLEMGLHTEGLEDMREALRRDPTNTTILNNLAVYFEDERGDFAQALFYYDQAIRLGDEVAAENAAILRKYMQNDPKNKMG